MDLTYLATAHIRAGLSFMKTLLGPLDSVDSICFRGHPLLKNWSNCPECKLLNREDELKKMRRASALKPPQIGLYCLSGSNLGQVFFISSERTTIGVHVGADIVLTPESLNTSANYQILFDGTTRGKTRLTSSETHYFKLNGQIQQSSTLLDFDELEILDNRFLVLDFRTTKGGSANDR